MQKCECQKCREANKQRFVGDGTPVADLWNMRMYVCLKCGNKRCPKIIDHRFKCTGSNAVGQVGELEDEFR